MPKPLLSIAAAVCLIGAGCGSGGSSDSSAIRTLLERSHASLYHYRDPLWWGRPVPVTLSLHLARGGSYARAVVRAGRVRQFVLLRKRGDWRIVDTGATTTGIFCRDAPAEVLAELFGGCAAEDVFDGPWLRGPRATRPPTGTERRALEAFERGNLFHGHDRCVTYDIRVSRVDPRWALVGYRFHEPYANCPVGNGESLVARSGARWREVGEASSGFACDEAPPGVVGSLDGSCELPAR